MESGPDLRGATSDVVYDVVLADGEVIKVLGANASVQEGPLPILRPLTLRMVPAGDGHRFGVTAG
ncbi:MAG TPA: hypothetical protein VGQ80_08020 [Acidimicrobiia bacterium]|jgi:hypothetical protein|nr:hypothetical protein [Actinomycetota bacterium]MDQ1507471.1 hypothetical protein [Actinomycetota bacterium]HEV7686499.1 hypothetical protein [Acidimicrobiia bacterium]